MQIVVPMSGVGQRFLNAGYTDPKPLIRVHDKPIIEHVIQSFPDESDFVFICNENHLRETHMRSILYRAAQKGVIVSIKQHKLGPVYAIMQAAEHIKDDQPVMVSFCDYAMQWDYAGFKEMAARTECDGAIPYYTGFHPHLLNDQLYGTILTDRKGRVLEFKEKNRYDPDPFKNKHNPGAYYFRSGRLLKECCEAAMRTDDAISGEWFMHTVYQLMLQDGLFITSWEVPVFMQWGKPEDFEQYLGWVRLFESGEMEAWAEQSESNRKIYEYWKPVFSRM